MDVYYFFAIPLLIKEKYGVSDSLKVPSSSSADHCGHNTHTTMTMNKEKLQ